MPTNTCLLLKKFNFVVVTLNSKGREIDRYTAQNQCFVENLAQYPQDQDIDLVIVAIPKGQFEMGSPYNDIEVYDNEKPQHQVSVQSFSLSQYPITQAQWRTVAALPQVHRSLVLDPSKFKGLKHPVENISWYEAIEFCQRLFQYTGREYRLPSEAEWEYACRGNTTSPFHFGEGLSHEFANFNPKISIFGLETTNCLSKTTSVDHFQTANPFGLYDLHGNVYEWCADHWHSSYQGAPSNGKAWLSDEEYSARVIRGGFWMSHPHHCRSTYRDFCESSTQSSAVGFRVACSVGVS